MEQPQYLIDTNALIDYLGGKLPPLGMRFMDQIMDATPYVSVISKIELLGFKTSQAQHQLLKNLIADITVLNLTEEVVANTISIRRSYRIKLPDAIIAATAISHGFTLITRNLQDFTHIDGLKLLNPHHHSLKGN